MSRVAQAAQAARSFSAYADTTGRAIHIKIHPEPQNLGESTEVLRVLQQYGEVVMYKHLKHEPNLHAAKTALAIYQSTYSAQNILNASPLEFEIQRGVSKSSPSNYPGSTQTSAAGRSVGDSRSNMDLPEPRTSHDGFSKANNSTGETVKFHLEIDRSVLNHQTYIKRQHYYSGFRLDEKTLMAEDLERRVPFKGLMDCSIKKGEVPLRIRMKRDEEKVGQIRTLGDMWREAQRKRQQES